MNTIKIGIGDYSASRTPGDKLVTYALGSCVALVLTDPQTGVTGMAHIALPRPGKRETPRPAPGYYATDAVPALLAQMAQLGADPSGRGFVAKLVGGASVISTMTRFDIGKRNVLAVRKLLWRYGLAPTAEDTGGELSRTVSIHVGERTATISNPARGSWTV